MKYKNVLVSGGNSFLGRTLVPKLKSLGYEVDAPRSSTCDLLTDEGTKHFYRKSKVDVVINLAAICGGIQANADEPGRFFYENLKMGMNLIEGARINKIKKFIQIGSVCSFPRDTPIPFKEEDFYNGYPDPSNAPYGLSKRALLDMLQSYRRQYGMNGIYLTPINAYGAHDHFNTTTSHVIPAMITKILRAKNNNEPFVQCWGSGNQTREFLYTEDFTRGVIQALEYYDGADPINLKGGNIWGDNNDSGSEINMRYLATIIKDLIGYNGEIIWNPQKAEGQPRRSLSGEKAKQFFGYEPKVSLYDGLKETISWATSSEGPLRSSV